MNAKVISGNIFTSNCQTIVNTVNCVGVMGTGIALECRLRYPIMHERYIQLCNEKKINIGLLWIYKSSDRWILNFPTKKHWKYPSKVEYLHAGLDKFASTYQEKNIQSIAFPLLGADKGGIPQEESINIMMSYLENLPINILIYRYDQKAKDDLFDKTKEWLLLQDIDQISVSTGLRRDFVSKVMDAMQSPNIFQLNQLARVNGIGIKTLEKMFAFSRSSFPMKLDNTTGQQPLL